MQTAKTNQDNLEQRIMKSENVHYQILRLFLKTIVIKTTWFGERLDKQTNEIEQDVETHFHV